MALEVLPVVRHTPVLAGVNGTDPFCLMPQFQAELRAVGFSGALSAERAIAEQTSAFKALRAKG